MNLTAGAVLKNGKYILGTPLGQGIFGITYRATHVNSGQTVVIKTLNESLWTHPNFERFRQQFESSARRLAKVKHPHLVRVLDLFQESRQSFIVMEYIEGQTLAEITDIKPLPEEKAIDYIRQIGNALSLVHKAGLLHWDIKPQNIIRRQGTDDVVLVIGIAGELTPGMIQTHASLVSPGYAAIEQYFPKKKRTPATDIYALAATLYCLLTGEPPIPASLREKIPLPDLRQLQPNLGKEAIAALGSGLEMKAESRPQTVKNWLALLPSSSIPEILPIAVLPQQTPSPQSPVPSPQPLAPQKQKQEQDITKGVNWNLSPKLAGKSRPYKTQVSTAPKKPKTPVKTKRPIALVKLKISLPNVKPQEAIHRLSTKLSKVKITPALPNLKPPKLTRPKTLMMTAAIATCAGAGFGLAIRYHAAISPGSSILHTEQSFPARNDWPISDIPEPTPQNSLLSPPSAIVIPVAPAPVTLPPELQPQL
ncbi:serine/threonine protein kinase [Cyanobacteria bacterium FACHB-472]|nr:serine/threonine protein kinase [Cyanobacteria bacterium FACHB-472]